MKDKLTSRKFWLALISIIVGILGIFGADDNLIQSISSILLILVPAVIYIITEGRIDAAALQHIDLDDLLDSCKKLLGFFDEDEDEETEAETDLE